MTLMETFLLSSFVVGAPSWIVPAIVMGMVALIVVGFSYWYTKFAGGARFWAAFLKMVAIAALLICLIDPLFSGDRPRKGANVFSLLVDKSASMHLRPGDTDVLQKSICGENEWQARLAQDFDVRNYTFDAQLRGVDNFVDVEFDGKSSSLATSLRTLATRLGKRSTAGVLLFSDGNATDLEAYDGNWAEIGIPVYPVLLPERPSNRDLRVESARVSQTNFEAAPTTIDTTVATTGIAAGKEVVGRLIDSEGKIVEETSLQLSETKPNRFRVRFRPEKSGISFYDFQTIVKGDEPSLESGESENELTVKNNVRTLMVDRGGGPYKVLYVAGRPNWEFKFLRRALQADDEIELAGLLRIARKEPRFTFRDTSKLGDDNRLFDGFENKDEQDTEQYDQPVLIRLGIEDEAELRDGFPKSAEELFKYHAIIIDDLEANFFSPDQMVLIREFVRDRGGGLMMLGGMESFSGGGYDRTPLGELLPVYTSKLDGPKSDQPMRWKLTREGELQPWVRTRSTNTAEQVVQAEMPGFLTFNRVPNIKAGASLLAEATDGKGNTVPAFVIQRFGSGRTAALTLGDMWRWSLGRKEGRDDDLAQVWRQVTRWLVADVPKRVEIGECRYVPSKPVTISVTARDEKYKPLDNARVSLTVVTPDLQEFEMEANPTDVSGVYTAEYWPRQDGGFRVRASVEASDGSAVGNRESGWTASPAASEFESIERATERLEEIARQTGGEVVKLEELDALVASLPNRKMPITESWVYPLWHGPHVLGLVVLCLCGEWGLRRWKGLP